MKHWSLVVLAGVLLGSISGCGGDDSGSGPSNTAESAGNITVFAAASLKSTFTELGDKLKADNPGAQVQFSFAGSSDLAAQIDQGAPADVFASADQANMKKVTDAGLAAGAPVNFATNTLTIVTAPGNPKGIKTFADLTRSGLQVVVCAPQVPCGSATKKVEDATNDRIAPVSEESSVTDVLGKVTSGQADAGLVYVTDAAGAGDKVATVTFPEATRAVNTYPIVVLKNAQNPALAKKFVDLVNGPDGREVLRKAGFQSP